MSDLFGQPLSTHGLAPDIRARMLYAAGDASPARSEARAEFYRAAGQAQREADTRAAVRDAKEDERLRQRATTRARFARKGVTK